MSGAQEGEAKSCDRLDAPRRGRRSARYLDVFDAIVEGESAPLLDDDSPLLFEGDEKGVEILGGIELVYFVGLLLVIFRDATAALNSSQ